MSRKPPDINLPSRFKAISGLELEKILAHWICRPEVDKISVLTMSIDPRHKLAGLPLYEILESRAADTDITVVTAGIENNNARNIMASMSNAGVKVMLNQNVHAKIYMLGESAEGGRKCWVVGSSNLTHHGLNINEEVNLQGHHEEDYSTVDNMVDNLISNAWLI